MTHSPQFLQRLSPSRLGRAAPVLLLLASCASPRAEPVPVHADLRPAAAPPPAPLHIVPTADVEARVTEWRRLMTDGGIPASDYAAFLDTTPDWPDAGILRARLQHALANEADPDTLARICPNQTLTQAAALLRCGGTLGAAPLAAQARRGWIGGINATSDESAFLALFGSTLTPADQSARFDHQLTTGQYDAARRQIPRLAPSEQAVATARVALRSRADDAEDTLAQVGTGDDPGLLLDHLYWLRRMDRTDDALALWKARGIMAEASSPLAFASERASFAHTLVTENRFVDALVLADDRTLSPQSVAGLDAAFLTGWLALEKLNDAPGAVARFQTVAASTALISRSRGLYWLGRAQAASGDTARAHASFVAAAAMPTTFYGQMALANLAHVQTLLTPAATGSVLVGHLPTARRYAHQVRRTDLLQAAKLLVTWGDQTHARDFLAHMENGASTTAERATIAQAALSMGAPDVAVAAARHAGRDGVVLWPYGWPQPFTTGNDTLPPGLSLAVMRQESSFNPAAVSGAHAYGLMQLLPAAAHDVAHHAHMTIRTDAAALVDPQTNITLGGAYLTQLMERFGQVVPYVLSAYNAGPHRTDEWIGTFGDPGRTGGTQEAMIDWIETVPYVETRNYIQRVEENFALYQAMEVR